MSVMAPCPSFPKYNSMSCVAISVTEFVNFNSETFVFLWDILLECNLPFEKYNYLVNYHMFRRAVKFRIRNTENIKNFPNFPQSVIMVVFLVNFVIVCEMQVT